MNELTNFFAGIQAMTNAPSLGMILASLAFAFLAGQAVAWIYMWTHSGVSYSRSFVQSLVLLAIIMALVMMVVGSNVVVAFGLIGALTVIRFRNVLKDTRDTTYVFMEIVVGLGAGTTNFLAITVGVVFFALVMMYLKTTGFGTRHGHDALLRFEALTEGSDSFIDVLARHCRRSDIVSQRADSVRGVMDYSYRLLLRDPQRTDELVRELTATEGVSGVSLLRQEDQSEV
ncbi:DUF4956 domain-containing protein [bacterium]|nr:DUF4956 domain-containing protein [bacterium]